MEEQCSPLSWAYYYQEEGVDELKKSLVYSTLELEAAVISEISRKDDEILQLKGLLSKIIKERDEFQAKSQQLVLEKQMLFQQVQVFSKQHTDTCPISSGEGEDASDSDDNNIVKRPLPEQGKFLQAVMEAGPLLQTLLLAGPLPRWQHPPPQLSPIDIPPVTITSPTPTNILNQDSCIISPRHTNNRDASDFSPTSKYQKLCSPIIIDPNI